MGTGAGAGMGRGTGTGMGRGMGMGMGIGTGMVGAVTGLTTAGLGLCWGGFLPPTAHGIGR